MSFMEFRSGIFGTSTSALADVERGAREQGFPVFTLSVEGQGREAFFAAVRAQLPLSPPVESARSWEALEDSLWEGIRLAAYDRLVVLWPDSDSFRSEWPADYEYAVSVLEDVALLLTDETAMCAPAKTMSVFVVTS